MAILAMLVAAVSDRRSAVETPPLQRADLKVGATSQRHGVSQASHSPNLDTARILYIFGDVARIGVLCA
jgi:hypothetical protein